MKKITSFTVDHRYITEGIYISRVDGAVTTYDLRTRKPNCGDYMDNETMHTFEHLFATYVRNSQIADDILYFGPMGCQTGFYLLVQNADTDIVRKTVIDVLEKIIAHKGEVFGASEIECGNYKSLNLESAQSEALRYLKNLENDDNNFKYPKGE